uniref:IS3 family transposase n=1 Tax=Acetatifactor sp. TaxID=1872090 RepID=UPI004055DAFD
MAKRYTEELKLTLVGMYEGGSTAKAICAEYGVSRSTLLLWAKQYSADSNGQIPREQYLMRKELERLRIENQIYKECGCSAYSSLAVRLDAIHRLKNKYSIHALCRVLNVNRSTVYHHELRAPEKTQVELQDEILKPLVTEIFKNSNELFGVRRIRVKLKEKGYVVSERRIGRLMKELGLYVKKNGPRLNSANDRQYQYYPNRLQSNFLTAAPNMVWVSDITYARVGHDFLYLCVVIDLYARKVISFAISEVIDENLVTEAFERAYISRLCPKKLLFHSDQGTQYTAFEFRKKLREYGVTQSFSAPGNPYDNAVVESFFASIKKEDFRKNFYKTEAEFKIAVAKYIDFYNDYRPHQRLGYLTPNQAEAEYNKSHSDDTST